MVYADIFGVQIDSTKIDFAPPPEFVHARANCESALATDEMFDSPTLAADQNGHRSRTT